MSKRNSKKRHFSTGVLNYIKLETSIISSKIDKMFAVVILVSVPM